MILVTGATGSNGTEIVKCLATGYALVRAMVCHLHRASAIALPHVEVVEGGFDRPAGAHPCRDGGTPLQSAATPGGVRRYPARGHARRLARPRFWSQGAHATQLWTTAR
jgi:uncharacterized protein YbjT (DUF2867 family)